MNKTNKDISEETISKNQHLALNNLNMLMYWIRKKKLTEDQLQNIRLWTDEALLEIKKA